MEVKLTHCSACGREIKLTTTWVGTGIPTAVRTWTDHKPSCPRVGQDPDV